MKERMKEDTTNNNTFVITAKQWKELEKGDHNRYSHGRGIQLVIVDILVWIVIRVDNDANS